MNTFMLVLRYGDENASLDACIVFVECEKVTAKIKKEVVELAESAGIQDPDIISTTELFDANLSDMSLYPMQAYSG